MFRIHAAPYLFQTYGEWPDDQGPTDTSERVDNERVERTARDLDDPARRFAGIETAFSDDQETERLEVGRFRDVVGTMLTALGLTLRTCGDVGRRVALLRQQAAGSCSTVGASLARQASAAPGRAPREGPGSRP